ncbi:hypothetical protein [Bradyrhizobium sp. USDA 4508]
MTRRLLSCGASARAERSRVGAGQDQFVFAPNASVPLQHTITNFALGIDKLDVRQFSNLFPWIASDREPGWQRHDNYLRMSTTQFF